MPLRYRNWTAAFLAGIVWLSIGARRGDAQPFTWQIAPFEVLGEAGRPFHLPFLGGFNVPRPQLIDIDADGDPDLFIQEHSGELIFFEHNGSGDAFPYTWQTHQYQKLEIGEWNRFADIDGDGDFDLLAEQPFGYIRYFRNKGTPESPVFEPAADTLKDDAGMPVYSDRQNIPNVIDIDCNGRLDLFIGRLDGTISRYEATAYDGNGAPIFTFWGDRFQDIEIVGRLANQASRSGRHGANTLLFKDLDADGDPDLLWGDFFEPGLLLLENVGSCESPDFSASPASYPIGNPVKTSGYNAPAVGDVNLDGKLDMLIGVLGGAFSAVGHTADNLIYYEAGDGEGLQPVTERFLSNLDVGSDAVPVLQDLDGDGDSDLVLTNSINPEDPVSARAFWLENHGAKDSPRFRYGGELPLEPSFNYAPAFGDLDDDGDADMLVGAWQGGIAWYRNEGGTARFVLADVAIFDIPSGSNRTPALGDLDADGDLDALVGEADGTLNLFRNIGTPANPAFDLEAENYGAIDVGHRSAPVLYDLDDDGDLDLVVGSDQDGLQAFPNTGTPKAPVFGPPSLFNLSAARRMAPTLGDINGDGAFDLFVGTQEGGVLYFENERVDTGLNEALPGNASLQLDVFPNPSSGQAMLLVRLSTPLRLTGKLFDALGRFIGVIFEEISGQEAIPLDIGFLPAGIYFIQVQTEEGHTVSHSLFRVQ